MQFWPPDDEHMCSKHVEAWNKLIVKHKILCIKLVNYWDKYTEMHGQQNVKKNIYLYMQVFGFLQWNNRELMQSYFAVGGRHSSIGTVLPFSVVS